MKKYFLIIVVTLFLNSCKDEVKPKVDVSSIPVQFKIERFDQLFYESKPEDLAKLKSEYPFLFPNKIEDSVWTNKLKTPILKELYQETQLKYKNLDTLENEIEEVLKYTKYYFPETKTPRVITVISEVDLDAKAIFNQDYLFLSLDCYLGEKHRYYEGFPAYKRIELNKNQILPDIVSSFTYGKIATPKDRNLLSLMIYKGKELYVKDIIIPKVANHVKIAYTAEKYKWCEENESQMWSFFIENQLLYDANPKTEQRFMSEAPFSKFYLEIDNESPGRIGHWIGWQIVKSYMKNYPETSIKDLLKMDAKELLEKSKYKPKK